jgi:3-oxoacyl-[acyl-carrier protein] reductase
MYEEFKGKSVIVTGASTGIGRGAALRFGAEGAKVVVVASGSMDKAEAVAAEIRAKGGEAIAVRCDVSNEAQVEAMVA